MYLESRMIWHISWLENPELSGWTRVGQQGCRGRSQFMVLRKGEVTESGNPWTPVLGGRILVMLGVTNDRIK